MFIGDKVIHNKTKIEYIITNIDDNSDIVKVTNKVNENIRLNGIIYTKFPKEELTLKSECIGERKVPDGVITEDQLRKLLVDIVNVKDFEIKTTLYEKNYYGWRGYQVITDTFNISFAFENWNHLTKCLLKGFEISWSYDQCQPTYENVERILKSFKSKIDAVVEKRKKAISILCD